MLTIIFSIVGAMVVLLLILLIRYYSCMHKWVVYKEGKKTYLAPDEHDLVPTVFNVRLIVLQCEKCGNIKSIEF